MHQISDPSVVKIPGEKREPGTAKQPSRTVIFDRSFLSLDTTSLIHMVIWRSTPHICIIIFREASYVTNIQSIYLSLLFCRCDRYHKKKQFRIWHAFSYQFITEPSQGRRSRGREAETMVKIAYRFPYRFTFFYSLGPTWPPITRPTVDLTPYIN